MRPYSQSLKRYTAQSAFSLKTGILVSLLFCLSIHGQMVFTPDGCTPRVCVPDRLTDNGSEAIIERAPFSWASANCYSVWEGNSPNLPLPQGYDGGITAGCSARAGTARSWLESNISKAVAGILSDGHGRSASENLRKVPCINSVSKYNFDYDKRSFDYHQAVRQSDGLSTFLVRHETHCHYQRMTPQLPTKEFVRNWIDAVVKLRLPSVPLSGLREIDPKEGWLGGLKTACDDGWYTGCGNYEDMNHLTIVEAWIAPYDQFEGDRSKASWLPDEEVARLWYSAHTGKEWVGSDATGIAVSDGSTTPTISHTINSATLSICMPHPDNVRIDAYGLNGQLISRIVDKKLAQGNHTINIEAARLAKGSYVLRIMAGKHEFNHGLTITE